VKITADTNLLLRALTGDDPAQAEIAQKELATASLVAIPIPVFCEMVWVLARGYRLPRAEISAAIRTLIASETVACARDAVDAGIKVFESGGDFADGAIAAEGRALGGDTFFTFDKDAADVLSAQGYSAKCL
jgi:predicted nucleic-acid-binding protein